MELAVPIFNNDKIYDIVDIKKPTPGVATTAYESMIKYNIFKAMLDFISGSIETLYSINGEGITEPNKIKSLCGLMPYMSAEAVALKMMALLNEDDTVEGVYKCPRCGKKIITDKEDVFENPADKISDLEVVCMQKEEYTNSIPVILSDPVKIKNQKTGDVLEQIDNFDLRYPTLNDCMMAGRNMSEGQEVRMQFKLYLNAMTHVNGKETDRKWIATYGMPLLTGMGMNDLKIINDAMQKYGLKKTVRRECCNCGKIWDAVINTSNFFASGLQPM